ncbi:MAG: tetratricopeptide repeat protein [Microbacterium sp.]
MSDAAPGSVLRGAVDLSALKNRPAAPPAGQTGAAAGTPSGASTLVFDATDATFGDVLELSKRVPVVVDLWAEWCRPCTQLSPILEKVVIEQAGRLVLAKVDLDQNPQLAQAFRAQSIPMVVALLQGQPVPLFNGAVPEQQVREVFSQLLTLAEQNGVTGRVPVGDSEDAEPEPEPELPPLHQEALAAIEAGDYARAAAAYEKQFAENPQDDEAKNALGQVKLLERVQYLDAAKTREAAAANPLSVETQFAVADLDLAGGHVDDAFGRLLDLFSQLPTDERGVVRERLIELFDVIGSTDPRVIKARSRLTSLLF